MSDGRKPGERDLADVIWSLLVDDCRGQDGIHLESIYDETMAKWEQDVRNLLENLAINQYQDESGKMRLQVGPTQHAGDCTIYAALHNGQPTDGICTCGYGWHCVRRDDWSKMYSAERIVFCETERQSGTET